MAEEKRSASRALPSSTPFYLATPQFGWILAGLVAGYGPATFTYPVYSFFGDRVMWKDMLAGRVRF